MSIRTTLILLILLGLVGAAAFFLRPQGEVNPWDKPTPTLTEDIKPALLKTLGLDIHRVTRLTLTPAGKPALTFARVGDGWQLTAPFAVALKTAQVEGLILAPLQETQDWGYAGPISHITSATLDLTTDQNTTRLSLGPTQGAGVGLLEVDGRTHRTSSHLHDLLANLPPLAALAEPKLDLPPAAEITRITANTPRGETKLARVKNGWALDLPGTPRASVEAVTAYCAALAELSIVEIPQNPGSEAQLGFDHPALRFTLETAAGPTTLEIGGPTGPTATHYFFRLTKGTGAPLIATIETKQMKPLIQGQEFFRDWQVVRMKAEDVRRVKVEKDGVATLDLTLDANGKVLFTDKATPVVMDEELGKASFEALLKLKPTGISSPLGITTHRVTLTDAFGREEALELWDQGKFVSLQHKGDAESLSVPAPQIAPLLLATAESLRDRAIHWLPEGEEFTEIYLEQKACRLIFIFVKKDGRWTEENGVPFEESALLALEKALRHPRVERFTPAGPTEATATLATLDATAHTKADEHELSLYLDLDHAGTLDYSGGPDEPVHAAMPPAWAKLLAGEFRPRQLISLAPAQIPDIDILRRKDKKRIRIHRRDDGVFETTGATLTQASCAALADAFGSLRAEEPALASTTGYDTDDTYTVNLRVSKKENYSISLFDGVGTFTTYPALGETRFFKSPPDSPQAKALKAVIEQWK